MTRNLYSVRESTVERRLSRRMAVHLEGKPDLILMTIEDLTEPDEPHEKI